MLNVPKFLEDILFIAIASVICGLKVGTVWKLSAKPKKAGFALSCVFRAVSRRTILNRVFSALNPEELESSFISWTRSVAELTDNEVVSIDGKGICGTRGYGSKSIVYMVSAWVGENHIALGQLKVEEKSNEITAIPGLPGLLVLKGCIVSIDSMGCQKGIVSAIVEKGADYLISVKGFFFGRHRLRAWGGLKQDAAL